MKLKAIIVDDEKNSRDALAKKIAKHHPDIEIVSLCEDGEQAIAAIEANLPDIVFLDVEMPVMNGFTMLQRLVKWDFELIFTTAYDHYAIQAIRYSALDYLVKPIDVDELKAALDRATKRRNHFPTNQRIENLLHNLLDKTKENSRIAIPSQEGIQFLEMAEIIYLEAESNYTAIYLKDSLKITVSKTLGEFEDLLSNQSFIRIHHSHIINKQHIKKYIRGEGGQVIMSNGKTLDVARRRKEEFIKSL